MDFTPAFYLLATIVILLTGMDKGGFARGMGTMAVPALALLLDPRVAAAIMLPILCSVAVPLTFSYESPTMHYLAARRESSPG